MPAEANNTRKLVFSMLIALAVAGGAYLFYLEHEKSGSTPPESASAGNPQAVSSNLPGGSSTNSGGSAQNPEVNRQDPGQSAGQSDGQGQAAASPGSGSVPVQGGDPAGVPDSGTPEVAQTPGTTTVPPRTGTPAVPDNPAVPEPAGQTGQADPGVPGPDAARPSGQGGSAVAGQPPTFTPASPLTPEGNVVRGEVPDASIPLDTHGLYEEGTGPEGLDGQGPEDSIVGMGFINDLARFLADNYWPAGTHPSARGQAASTADIKWANLKYGGQLEGFVVNHNYPDIGRQRVLNYVLMPSMVKGLYRLYGERFVAALGREASTRKKNLGGRERTLAAPEIAQMFSLYARQTRSLAVVMRTYMADAGSAARVQAYIKAEEEATAAHLRYSEELQKVSPSSAAARNYQSAVVLREQARENLASALRKGGNTDRLDTDSLVYMAMWMHRRQPGDLPALHSLMQVMGACADRLEQESAKYKNLP